MIAESDIKQILKPRPKFASKADFGHALFIGGGYGKIGAAVLASKACLQSGVGLLTTYIPECGYAILQTAVPEAMCITDPDEKVVSLIPSELSRYTAVGIGPGIGLNNKTVSAFRNLIENYRKPTVIDADAINILANNRELIAKIPQGSILTPHSKEMERLSDAPFDDRRQQIESAKKMCSQYNIFIVLKGAETAIVCPNGDLHINQTGNPWMATAGSGDVLCGMILALLAQGISPEHSAVAGVYLHGQAGDNAAKKRIPVVAGDIVENIDFSKLIPNEISK